MDKKNSYQDKLKELKKQAIHSVLPAQLQTFIDSVALRYKLTHQEFRQLSEISRDLEMWQEQPLEEIWHSLEKSLPLEVDGPRRKKQLMDKLHAQRTSIQQKPKEYPAGSIRKLAKKGLEIIDEESEKNIFGYCPVASDKTVCCNLRTVDAVENCAFGCTYCTIQTFYGNRIISHADLRKKLDSIQIEPDRFYHIGTGQSSDALHWGNRNGILDELCHFADLHQNILFEFKTKSDNIEYFLKKDYPRNIVCSWTLNTDAIINNEELLTASLDERLISARRLADRGIKVAFHFHPLVFYKNWQDEVYFYLCMEKPEIWDALFGWHYSSREEFEEDYGRQTMSKL